MTATYATVQELVQFLNVEGTVPSRKTTGSDRPDETVGTGDSSTTKFYLDFAYVIGSTYTFRYSAAEGTTGTALVETTDYTLDKDDGTLTLTATGVTAVGTDIIFATYSFNEISLTDTALQAALDRAQEEIDDTTDTHFATATDTTPDYAQATNEKQDGKGNYDRGYFLLKYPLPTVSASITGTAIVVDDTTIYVDSTTGFLSSGYIGIGADKIAYTGKTTTTFTGCTGTDTAHGTAVDVVPHVVEVSTTASGSEPTWTILDENSEYDIDKVTGRIWVYRWDYFIGDYGYSTPNRLTPNRFRATYMYGHDTIPADIKRCCLMIAAKEIKHMIVNSKLAYGINEFKSELIDIDEKWISDTLQRYSSIQSANV